MARLIDADILLQNFDDMEPYEEYESEHDLWLDMRMEVIHAPTITPPPITGDTSDGCHTFNELYHHRAVLFSVVCNEQPDIAWKSKRHHDGTMYDGMFIVGINTPEGQATYHYYIDPYWELFRIKELEYAPEWDGHTPDEAIRRIGTLTPPNEPMLGRVAREYLEICGEDCAGDPSVGIPECPFFQCADVLDNGKLIQPKCELAAYRRPPEGEE